MRKQIKVILALLLVILSPSIVIGATGSYMNIQVGVSILENMTLIRNDTIVISDTPVSGNLGAPSLPTPLPRSNEFSVETRYENGVRLSGLYGYDFGLLRLAGEISYAKSKVQHRYDYSLLFVDVDDPWVEEQDRYQEVSQEISALSLMANGYYDFENRTGFTPYLMGGIGAVKIDVDGGLASGDDTVMAYQIGVGISAELSEYIWLDIGYSYFSTEKAKFGSGSFRASTKYKSQNFSAAILIDF